MQTEEKKFFECYYQSPIGRLTLVGDVDENIIGLWIDGQKFYKENISSEITLTNSISVFNKTRDWLDRYFGGDKPDSNELPLKPYGNSFRQFVWKIISKIPYGETMTYGDIARIVSREQNKLMSSQAVGGAVAHNPISIIIPCHRVIGSNGNLIGYAGGLNIKRELLELEKGNMEIQ